MDVEIPVVSDYQCFVPSGSNIYLWYLYNTPVTPGDNSSKYKYRREYILQDNHFIIYKNDTMNGSAGYSKPAANLCLTQGDIVYKPEYKEVIFPLLSLCAFLFILCLVYKIIVKRLMP